MPAPSPHSLRPSASAERAVERLSDDETLRGSLTDEGFGPLLEVISYVAIQKADAFESTDALYGALRAIVQASVTAAETGDAATLERVIPGLLTGPESVAFDQAARGIGPNADQSAVAPVRSVEEGGNGAPGPDDQWRFGAELLRTESPSIRMPIARLSPIARNDARLYATPRPNPTTGQAPAFTGSDL